MIHFFTAILDHQAIDLEGTEPPELLELENDLMLHAKSPICYKLHVAKVSSGALVTGEASTVVTGECGRCLVPVEKTVSTGNMELFYELDGVEELDVTEDVRAELLLNLPANLLCKEDCLGLCPVCGANRNTEKCDCVIEEPEEDEADDGEPSPWDALDSLKMKDER